MKNSFFLALSVLLATLSLSTVFAQAPSVLRFEFETLNDDLRGGGENANIDVLFQGNVVRRGVRAEVNFLNINNDGKWDNNSINRFEFTLDGVYKPENIREIKIRKTRSSTFPAINGDNWVTTIRVFMEYDGGDGTMVATRLNGINTHHFTLEEHTFRLSEQGLLNEPRTPAEERVRFNIARNASPCNLIAYFKTGGDDLRGGNDNINLELVHRNPLLPSPYRFTNINAKRKWNNNYERTLTLLITKELSPEDITEVRIIHTGGGGFDADNWDMSKFFLKFNIGGREFSLVNIIDVGLVHRFTGNSRQFSKRL